MKHEIKHNPIYGALKVTLEPNERLVSESGAMITMSKGTTLDVNFTTDPDRGGINWIIDFGKAFARKMLGAESLFMTHYTNPNGAEILIAPTLEGSVTHRKLNGEKIKLAKGAYLASAGDVKINIIWGGLSSFFSKNGFFHVEAEGTGDLWFSSFGSLEIIEVDGKYDIDNGHLVAWDSNLEMKIKRAGGGLKGLVASGEGLICEFQGKGNVYIQTRNIGAFSEWLSSTL